MSLRQQREIDQLREEVRQLREMVEKLMAKKPGRPKKEEKAA